MSCRSLIEATCLAGWLTAALLGCSDSDEIVMPMPETEDWGSVDGQPVERYTLKNDKGAVCKITNYGATVTELWLPDRDGVMADVVLGFDSVDDYVKSSPYFGCIAGRCANRIAGGRFELAGEEYELATNNGPNHLHGGLKGFDKVVWVNEGPDAYADQVAVTLSYRSEDGEEGYPGNLEVRVKYTLTNHNELVVEMSATTDKTTVVNLAHHSYWNLAGHDSGTILDHEVTLSCARYTPTDATLIPTGELAPVEGTPFDFREAKKVGADIAVLQAQQDAGHGGGYDLNYAVDGKPAGMPPAAKVHDPSSGRVMEIRSNQPGLQFYTGNFLDGIAGKAGAVYGQYHGLCLETQRYPDAVHHPSFPTAVLEPGATYRHIMVHRFSVQ